MPLAAETAPLGVLPPAPDAFASLLAALAAPAFEEEAGPIPGTSDSHLRDDVLALSCEPGLRAHEAREPQNQDFPTRREKNYQEKKSASLTIRMSLAECDQLKQRAAEAGLTVSAYLRSCTLEAESLRAQVKDALAAIRAATPQPPQPSPAESVTSGEPTRRWWQFSRPAQA
jgi:predicted DNA binding CopG/RHH family protein